MTSTPHDNIFDAIDATWPAAKRWTDGGITFRSGQGGGSRVSAATTNAPVTDTAIHAAAKVMTAMGQSALFMVQGGQTALDTQLARLGYAVKDPCYIYTAPLPRLTMQPLPHKTCFGAFPPLASQKEVWGNGGIGAARLAIMDRVRGPKISFLGRAGDTPAGTVFAAIHGQTAMLHALEVNNDHRRCGLGRHLTHAVAHWAATRGAKHLALITTTANIGANTLYASLGMEVVGQYHYRIMTKGTDT